MDEKHATSSTSVALVLIKPSSLFMTNSQMAHDGKALILSSCRGASTRTELTGLPNGTAVSLASALVALQKPRVWHTVAGLCNHKTGLSFARSIPKSTNDWYDYS